MSSSTSIQFLLAVSCGMAVGALINYIKDFDSASVGIKAHDVSAQLGPWYSTWDTWALTRRKLPLGPVIIATLTDGICGINEICVSRLPHGTTGRSSWGNVLSIIHSSPLLETVSGASLQDKQLNAKNSWAHVPLKPVTLEDGKLCVKISRATLMTLFALTNARCIYSYSSASGYRSGYPSYCGQWSISWPNGKRCLVSLASHDSHSASSDVYPAGLAARADKCMEMLAGIVTDGADWKIAFPGRAKEIGPWKLETRRKGFPAAHGSRHLYNMMGGKVFEVDLLCLVRVEGDPYGMLKLDVPCLAKDNNTAVVFISGHEQGILDQALDYLPWTSLSWSMHRGLRDILLAYGTPIMNRYRAELTAEAKKVVKDLKGSLVKRGWNEEFVQSSMEDMIASSVMARGGNSGDMVRMITAIVDVLLEHYQDQTINKDKTTFWRRRRNSEDVGLDLQGIVALTKFFVLEWSQELDYQLYHDIPPAVYLT